MAPIWTVKDMQAYYGVCRITVWRWVTIWGCPCVRTATGRMNFDPHEVKEWHRRTWEKAKCNTK